MDTKKLHIAILASPGLGHLIPVLVLGNRLSSQHGVKVTILVITTSTSAAESQLLKPLSGPQLVDILQIPPVDISHLIDADTKVVTQLCMMVREALPGVRSTIAGMEHRPDVFVGDLFCTEAFPIAAEFNMPRYLFVTSTAWFTALTVYCPVLDQQIVGEYVDQTDPLEIPGCKPVRPEDVVDPMLDRSDQVYREYVRIGIEFTLADGMLLNTWDELEPTSVEAFRKNATLRATVKLPSIYPIGPLKRPAEMVNSKSEVIEWLDMQPNESVLYVSFGSGGTLSAQQITELAWGLELSQQRFIWVVRPPANSVDESFFRSGSGSDGEADYLPEGFLTRTINIGLVVPLWAPQVEILRHPSVGGFISHCGWNSALESITNGVPMIAWPLYSEQRQNATMLAEELGVAVRPKVLPTKKVVDREEIEKMVRTIMENREGMAIRDKVKQLKLSGENAQRNEGSSCNNMTDFLKDAENRLK